MSGAGMVERCGWCHGPITDWRDRNAVAWMVMHNGCLRTYEYTLRRIGMARSQDKDKDDQETVEFQPDFSVEDTPGEVKAPETPAEPVAAKAEAGPRSRVPQDTAKAVQAVYLIVELLDEMHPTIKEDNPKYQEIKRLLGV